MWCSMSEDVQLQQCCPAWKKITVGVYKQAHFGLEHLQFEEYYITNHQRDSNCYHSVGAHPHTHTHTHKHAALGLVFPIIHGQSLGLDCV